MLVKRALYVAISTLYWATRSAYDGVRRVLGQRPRPRCVVLYYHGVPDEQRTRFHAQMRRLKSGTQVVPLSRLTQLEPGCVNVCLTFDDGLDSVRRNALPSLTRLGLPASIFVVTDNLGRPPSWPMEPGDPDACECVMTTEQVLETARAGVEIGSHTVHHPDLTTLSAGELRAELIESRRTLETLLGRTIRTLSLPLGSYSDDTVRMARAVGYELILTVDPQLADPGQTGGVVGRFKVGPGDWLAEFWLKVRGGYAWLGRIAPLRRAWSTLRTRLARTAPARTARAAATVAPGSKG